MPLETIRRVEHPTQEGDEKKRLPLRWAVILVAACTAGFAVGSALGVVAGVTVASTVAGLLHKILA
ncbi:hypothetical protein [Micromonospora echinofusca]|uniref:hypothetical protein n=1 Tax=Micromonospora echinofusca TaxID=47858 RepID=UPI0037194B5C